MAQGPPGKGGVDVMWIALDAWGFKRQITDARAHTLIYRHRAVLVPVAGDLVLVRRVEWSEPDATLSHCPKVQWPHDHDLIPRAVGFNL